MSSVIYLSYVTLIGIMSDFAKNRLRIRRSGCISLVAFLFVISQIMAMTTDDVTDLWKASLALGLAYGSLFGLFPTIAIELFGIGGCYIQCSIVVNNSILYS